MSQDISTNQSTSEPVAETFLPKPWSAETYADKLMDDLFSDIDRILEGGSKLPTEPAKSEYVSLQPLKIPPFAKPQTVMPLAEALAKLGDTANVESTATNQDSEVEPAANSTSAPPRRSDQSLNKLLLGAACGSLVVALILWWASHEKLLPLWLNFAPTPVPQNTLSQSDAQFINYMLRSVELLDRKAQASRQQTNPDEMPERQAGAPSVPSQPQTTVANNLPQAPNPVPTVVGIYIPGYPPPQYQLPRIAPPAPPAVNSIRPPAVNAIRPPAANSIQPPPANSIQPPAANSIQPPAANSIRPPAANSIRPMAVTPVSPQPSQLPQPPVVRGLVAPAPTVALTPIPTPAAPEAKHTLVGLLYLGERSAALFDISGVTQRVQVGEPIGSSGWTLVTVTKDEAIIRRNGEVRSIYAGQKF